MREIDLQLRLVGPAATKERLNNNNETYQTALDSSFIRRNRSCGPPGYLFIGPLYPLHPHLPVLTVRTSSQEGKA